MNTYKDTYTPIDPDFYEIFDQLKIKKTEGKIFYFNSRNELDDAFGRIQNIIKQKEGEFLQTNNDNSIRLDKIITVFGKPGPAYDEYEKYGNACLTCEDLGQF